MYATIRRTPDDLRAILARGPDDIARGAAVLAGEGVRVFCVGTGTSYHAALNAAYQLQRAGCDARGWASFDFATYTPTLREGDVVVLFAHTGTTGYSAASLAAGNAAGARSIAITGIDAPVVGATLTLRTGPLEKSAAYTASHTGAMFVTAQLAAAVSRRRGGGGATDTEFAAMPDLIDEAVGREAAVAEFARYALPRRTFCAGAGPDGVLALETALKARETAYTSIDALPTEQFIHGPMVTINPGDAAILVATDEPGRARTRELLTILDGIGLRTWVIGGLPDVPDSATVFALPELHPMLAPVLAVVPIQLFACHAAQLKGTNADTFRGDVPEYHKAWEALRF